MFRNFEHLENSSAREQQSRALEESFKKGANSHLPEKGRNHQSGPDSAKRKRQCQRHTGKGNATESTSTRGNANGR